MLAFVKEGGEKEKERKAWLATFGTSRGDRRGIIAVLGAYADGFILGSVRFSGCELAGQHNKRFLGGFTI